MVTVDRVEACRFFGYAQGDEYVVRKYRFKLYPNREQTERLNFQLERMRWLYNDLIAERIAVLKRFQRIGFLLGLLDETDGSRKTTPPSKLALETWEALSDDNLRRRIGTFSKPLGVFDQSKHIKEIRSFHPDYSEIAFATLEAVCRRVDNAWQTFFGQRRNGINGGFPKFQGKTRWSSFSVRDRFLGWSFRPSSNQKVWKLKVVGVPGSISARGCFPLDKQDRPLPIEIRDATLIRSFDQWEIAITVRIAKRRTVGETVGALDWGVHRYATISFRNAGSNNPIAEYQTNRVDLDDAAFKQDSSLKELEAKFSRKVQEYQGREWPKSLRRLKDQIAKRKRRQTRRRDDYIHRLTNTLTESFHTVVTEELNIPNMTKSAKGTIDAPGKNVAAKSGLNREILARSPAEFLNQLEYKLSEGGGSLVKLPTKKIKPSQTCPKCGHTEKVPFVVKDDGDRIRKCTSCGFEIDRDLAAVIVLGEHYQKMLKADTQG